MTIYSLAEKHRPKHLNDIIGQTLGVHKIQNVLKKGLNSNLLFYGPPGVGKTTAAQAVARIFWMNNAKETLTGFFIDKNTEEGWSTCFHEYTGRNLTLAKIRGEITQLTQYQGRRIIFIDEADGLSTDDQEVLAIIMEGSGNATFILSSNYMDKIQPRIQSRCSKIHFKALNASDIYNRLIEICKAEGLLESGASPDLNKFFMKLARASKGDLRGAINELETYHSDGVFEMEMVVEYLV